MKFAQFGASLSLCSFLFLGACGGTVEDVSGEGDGDAGDGDVGDGDAGDGDVGDGDVGDGDVGDGDGDGGGVGGGVACTSNYAYGLTVTVRGGALSPEPIPLPFKPALLPPDGGVPAPAPIPPPDGEGGGPSDVPALAPCFAEVVATEGDYAETLFCSGGYPGFEDCQCYGAGERSGAYTVTTTWGDVVQTQTADVYADECHVIGVQLEFYADGILPDDTLR